MRVASSSRVTVLMARRLLILDKNFSGFAAGLLCISPSTRRIADFLPCCFLSLKKEPGGLKLYIILVLWRLLS
jgi:hypothetical protein